MTITNHEWRKKEKEFYLPKRKPELVDVPHFQFITIAGQGNPNSPVFADYITTLYSVAYAIKMTLKKTAVKPAGYHDYTVYPLEGVWDLNEAAKKNFSGQINKDDFVFTLMIRQPAFVDAAYFAEMREVVQQKKQLPVLADLKFGTIAEGKCVQMLHTGSFDDEPASFAKMEAFATKENLKRVSKVHREIYLSDFRKTPSEKLKTVLRFRVNE